MTKKKIKKRNQYEKDLITLFNLKISLYDFLVPKALQLTQVENEDNDPQHLDGFILWHEEKMIEHPSFISTRNNTKLQIELYTNLFRKLKKTNYVLDTNSINNLQLNLLGGM